jgi:hypothetical protein
MDKLHALAFERRVGQGEDLLAEFADR